MLQVYSNQLMCENSFFTLILLCIVTNRFKTCHAPLDVANTFWVQKTKHCTESPQYLPVQQRTVKARRKPLHPSPNPRFYACIQFFPPNKMQ